MESTKSQAKNECFQLYIYTKTIGLGFAESKSTKSRDFSLYRERERHMRKHLGYQLEET